MCIIDSTVIGDSDSYKLIKEILYKEYKLLSVSEVSIVVIPEGITLANSSKLGEKLFSKEPASCGVS